MSFTSSVTAMFGGDTSGLRRAAQEAESAIHGFWEKGKSWLGDIGQSFLKAFLIGDVVGFVTKTLGDVAEKVRRLVDESRELGVSVESLQSWEKAVTKAGGSVEQAQKVFERARLEIDKLADGDRAATEAFEKLHLSASDFVGLGLDQSLELIARKYEENKNQVGAYSALVEILGARHAPQLMEALRRLGTEGFASLNSNTTIFSSLAPEAVTAIDGFERAVKGLYNGIKNFVGNVAGGFLEFLQVVGGLGAAAWNWVTGVKTDWDAVLLMTKKNTQAVIDHNAALAETNKQSQEHKVTTDDILTNYDRMERSIINVANGQEKLTALANEYTSLTLTAGSSLRTVQEREAAAAEAAKVKGEYDKLSADLVAKQAEQASKLATETAKYADKVDEAYNRAKLDALPAEEKMNYLIQQRLALMDDMSNRDKNSIEYKQDFIDLQRTELDIAKLTLDVDKQRSAEMQRQQQIVQQLNNLFAEARNASVQDIAAHMVEFDNVALPQYTDEQLRSVSSDVLLKLAQQLQGSIQKLESDKYTSPSTLAEGATNYYYRSYAESILQTNINRIADILKFRTQATGSRADALNAYTGDLLLFDQIYSQGNGPASSDSKTSQTLDQINALLRKVFTNTSG